MPAARAQSPIPSARLKSLRYGLERASIRAAARLLPLLPRHGLLELAHACAEVAFRCDARGRATALENLALCFPDRSPAWRTGVARASYRSMARTMADLFWMGRHLRPERLDEFVELHWSSEDSRRAALESRAIFLTPHYGNFEIAAAVWGHLGHPAMVVAQDFKNPALTPLFRQLRGASGHHIIPRERALLRLLRHLQQGGHVAFLADLGVDPRQAATPIRVFGRWISAPALPAILAERTGLPLLPALSHPLPDGRYRIEVLDPIVQRPGETRQQLAQRAWDAFAPSLGAHPRHWLWAYKHWRYLPEQAELPYPSYANRSKAFDRLLAGAAGEGPGSGK